MKKLFVLVALLGSLLVACKTAPEVVVYQSINATGEFALAALNGWADYCRSVENTPQRVTLAKHLEVKAVWDKYRAALDVAEKAVYAYKLAYSAWETTGKKGLAPSLSEALKAVDATQVLVVEFSDLVNTLKKGSN